MANNRARLQYPNVTVNVLGCYVFIASAAGTWTPVIGNLSGTTLLVQFSNAGGKVLTAEVDAGCDSIMWDNGNLWRAGQWLVTNGCPRHHHQYHPSSIR